MSSEFYREPIMWTSPHPGYNTADRERRSFVDGVEVVERVPAIGHVGDYENKRQAPGTRYIEVVRHEGHIVSLVLTNGAAHMDANTGWGLQQHGKCVHHGWFPVAVCPVALIGTGELQARHVRDKSLLGAQPCQPGSHNRENRCPHSLSEQKARSEQWGKTEAMRLATYRSAEDRMQDAMREGMREGNRDMASAIMETLKAIKPDKKER